MLRDRRVDDRVVDEDCCRGADPDLRPERQTTGEEIRREVMRRGDVELAARVHSRPVGRERTAVDVRTRACGLSALVPEVDDERSGDAGAAAGGDARRCGDVEHGFVRCRRDPDVAARVHVRGLADVRANVVVHDLDQHGGADAGRSGRSSDRSREVAELRLRRRGYVHVLRRRARRGLVDLRAIRDVRARIHRQDVDDERAGDRGAALAATRADGDRRHRGIEAVQELERRRVQDAEVDRAVQRFDGVVPETERDVVRTRRRPHAEVHALDVALGREDLPLHRRERHETGVVEGVALRDNSEQRRRPIAAGHVRGHAVDLELAAGEVRLVGRELSDRGQGRYGAVALFARDVLVPDIG